MKHVVSVGGGLSSTMALPRLVVEQYGKDNCDFIMCALPNEDKDVWRLIDAVEQELGITIKKIGLNLTPWDIFFKEHMMGSSRLDPCSRILKREQLAQYMKNNYDPADTILHLGITSDEIDRMVAVRKNWQRQGWSVDAPLADDPFITKQSLMFECKARYDFVPRLYEWGFSHNNCGGACIKAGHKEWARLLRHIPDVYEWWETNEATFREQIGTKATILRDRRTVGGKVQTTPLSLTDFRLRMFLRWNQLPKDADPYEGLDDTPACVYCEAA